MEALLELEDRRRRMRTKKESSKYYHGTIYESDFFTSYSNHNKNNNGSIWAIRIESDFNFNSFLQSEHKNNYSIQRKG